MKRFLMISSIIIGNILLYLLCSCTVTIPSTNQYTVTFKDYDGTILSEEIIEFGQDAKAPEDPIREGYNFIGWDKEYTNIQKNTIIIAKYELIEQDSTKEEYTVTFISNSETKIEPQKVKKGEKVSEPPVPYKRGYSFDGWYYNDEKWSFVGYVITEDITLNAKWSVVSYDITYTLNGGEYISNPLKYTVEDEFTLNNPTSIKEGYTFIGWTSSEIEEPILNLTIKNEINNKQFIANFKANTYTITLDPNGGKETFDYIEVNYDGSYDLTSYVPTKEGYLFLGWYDGENKIVKGTWKYTKNITLQAKWLINVYAIRYDLDGGIATNPSIYTFGEEIILNNPTKEGYTFIGWTSSEIEEPQLNVIIKNGIGNKHFVANYRANTYNISYKLNGGTISNDAPKNYTYGIGIEKLPVPKRDDYVFTGWKIGEIYTDSISKTQKGDLILDAHWEIMTKVYEIEYHLDSQSYFEYFPVTEYTIFDEVELIAPIKPGYKFLGWYDNVELTGEAIAKIPEGSYGKKDLYPAWEARTYTVEFVVEPWEFPAGIITPYGAAMYDVAEAPSSFTYVIGENHVLPVLTAEGYKFDGWYYIDGVTLIKLKEIKRTYTANFVFYAYWEKI